MPADRIRVLVVDDSAFARKVLRESLGTSADIEVVGIARDGLEALEKVGELKPDVITLDLVMPQLDGLGVLRALPAEDPPRVVVVSISGGDTELGIEALQLGAVDIVVKPTALATDRLYELSGELVQKVVAAGRLAVPRPPVEVAPLPRPLPVPTATKDGILVVGASTGGPQALTRLLTRLPVDFPMPIAVVLHIPAEYTDAFARRVDAVSALSVVEAAEGMPLAAGRALVARGGMHLKLRRDGAQVVAVLDRSPTTPLHTPSVDVLFESAARVYGAGTMGVVLTGMGKDGLDGARAIRKAGGVVLTEAERSCVVYGMPRSVEEAGLSSDVAPIEGMVEAILRRL